jgi:hypothetical protein
VSGTIVHFPLAAIRANPWQPRMHEDPAKIAELGVSLLDHYEVFADRYKGLIQVPRARVVTLEGEVVDANNTPGRLMELAGLVTSGEALAQLAYGHRRLAAFQYLAAGEVGVRDPDLRFAEMPLDLAALSDIQMAVIAAEENSKRSDLSWYEKAKSMNRFIADFGGTQGEIAPRFGLSDKSSVSQYIRAYETLVAFNDQGLIHDAAEGRLPLLHVLHLLPLLRDYPVQAKQWLAVDGALYDTKTHEARPAALLKNELDSLLFRLKPREKPKQPATPAAPPAAAQHWLDKWEAEKRDNPDMVIFLILSGRQDRPWLALGPDAVKVARILKCPVSHLNIPSRTGRIWEALLLAVPDRDTPWFKGVTAALDYKWSSRIETATELALATTSQLELLVVQTEQPAEPAISEAEKQAALQAKMASLFPGRAQGTPGNGQPAAPGETGFAGQPAAVSTSFDLVKDTMEEVSGYLRAALEALAKAQSEVEDETDQAILGHVQRTTQHALGPVVKMVEQVADPETLGGMRERLSGADDPAQAARFAMMTLAHIEPIRETKLLND